MTKEPEWVMAGYGSGCYQAKCRICKTLVELPFADSRDVLTFKQRDNVDQEEVFAYVFFWTLEKLRRECNCSEEERQSYDRDTVETQLLSKRTV